MVSDRLQSGIPGLDEVLDGGFVGGRAYLIRGKAGTGKTTLGLHFLAAGVQNNESGLLITLEEPVPQLQSTAGSLGFDLQTVAFLDLSPTAEFFAQVETYDIFSPAEVEREPMTGAIVEQVEALAPKRIFIDSMTQFRYLAADTFQFRKQILSFLRFLRQHGATVLLTSQDSQMNPDDDLQFMSDGVINLSFASEERTLRVSKFRGSDFRGGQHSFRLTRQGMQVFPQLVPDKYGHAPRFELISSGIPEIDELLQGGIERGTITAISGPSGVGKSTLAAQFMKEAAGRGERSIIYSFEESKETLLHRSRGINIAVDAMLKRGTLEVVHIEPLRYSPDEFAYLVRQEVEHNNVQIVLLDSLAGYRLSLRGEDLVRHLHRICKYLQNMGVAVLVANEIETITGDFRATEAGISYLADNIIFLRYFEFEGELRRAIGILKKRMSNFEKTLRQFEITSYGVKVGQPLTQMRGILTGAPELLDRES